MWHTLHTYPMCPWGMGDWGLHVNRCHSSEWKSLHLKSDKHAEWLTHKTFKTSWLIMVVLLRVYQDYHWVRTQPREIESDAGRYRDIHREGAMETERDSSTCSIHDCERKESERNRAKLSVGVNSTKWERVWAPFAWLLEKSIFQWQTMKAISTRSWLTRRVEVKMIRKKERKKKKERKWPRIDKLRK